MLAGLLWRGMRDRGRLGWWSWRGGGGIPGVGDDDVVEGGVCAAEARKADLDHHLRSRLGGGTSRGAVPVVCTCGGLLELAMVLSFGNANSMQAQTIGSNFWACPGRVAPGRGPIRCTNHRRLFPKGPSWPGDVSPLRFLFATPSFLLELAVLRIEISKLSTDCASFLPGICLFSALDDTIPKYLDNTPRAPLSFPTMALKVWLALGLERLHPGTLWGWLWLSAW